MRLWLFDRCKIEATNRPTDRTKGIVSGKWRFVVLLSSLFLFVSLSVHRLLFIQCAFWQYLGCPSSAGRSTTEWTRGEMEKKKKKRTKEADDCVGGCCTFSITVAHSSWMMPLHMCPPSSFARACVCVYVCRASCELCIYFSTYFQYYYIAHLTLYWSIV